MNMDLFAGRAFISETSGEKLDNGDWVVKVTIMEKLKEKIEDAWQEISIVAEAQDKKFDEAHKIAMASALQELNRMVYSRGLDSIFEGALLDAELENGTSNDNPSTPTQ